MIKLTNKDIEYVSKHYSLKDGVIYGTTGKPLTLTKTGKVFIVRYKGDKSRKRYDAEYIRGILRNVRTDNGCVIKTYPKIEQRKDKCDNKPKAVKKAKPLQKPKAKLSKPAIKKKGVVVKSSYTIGTTNVSYTGPLIDVEVLSKMFNKSKQTALRLSANGNKKLSNVASLEHAIKLAIQNDVNSLIKSWAELHAFKSRMGELSQY